MADKENACLKKACSLLYYLERFKQSKCLAVAQLIAQHLVQQHAIPVAQMHATRAAHARVAAKRSFLIVHCFNHIGLNCGRDLEMM